MNEIAKFVASERENHQISIAELSRRSGVPYSTLAQIEKGRCIPQIVTYEKIMDALGYDVVLMKKWDDSSLENFKEN